MGNGSYREYQTQICYPSIGDRSLILFVIFVCFVFNDTLSNKTCGQIG